MIAAKALLDTKDTIGLFSWSLQSSGKETIINKERKQHVVASARQELETACCDWAADFVWIIAKGLCWVN